jgi:hypothetical protein
MSAPDALAAAVRCAADTMPPLRLRVLADVAKHPDSGTAKVVKRLQLPRSTVDRTLQELHLLGLLTVDDERYGKTEETARVRWIYSLADTVDADSLEGLTDPGKFTRNVSTPTQDEDSTSPKNSPEMSVGVNSTAPRGPSCDTCAAPLLLARPGRTTCERCRLAAERAAS